MSRPGLALILLLLACRAGDASPYFFAPVQTLAYSEFRALLLSGHVHDLRIGEEVIEGQFDAPSARAFVSAQEWQSIQSAGTPVLMDFTVARIADPTLLHDLEANHVRYEASGSG